MPHDIIDNRSEKLLDHIERILPGSERARFAVGYLFLSGLKPIHRHLDRLREIRLLIGNTTSRETLETLAEGYKRLELIEEVAEEWRYPKRVEMQHSAEETAENLRDAISLMDQTDEDEATIRTVLRLIQEKRLKVRVYTKGRLHAKAYIFDYGKVYDLFRHSDRQRYRMLEGFLVTGRKCLFLTATPRNKTAWDVYHQIKLFHPEERTDLPINPPNLREFFRGVEAEEKKLQDVLVHVLIRRTRRDVLRWYGYDAETHERVNPARFDEYQNGGRRAYILVGGKHQFFPARVNWRPSPTASKTPIRASTATSGSIWDVRGRTS